MKKLIGLLIAAGLGFSFGAGVVSSRLDARHAAELAYQARQRAELTAERDNLEAALKKARQRSTSGEAPAPPAPARIEIVKRASPTEILDRLKLLKVSASQPRTARQAVNEFEGLVALGAEALPAIQALLRANEEIDYDLQGFGPGKATTDGKLATEFLIPPSLRLGLFEAVKRIGGAQAEQILSETLATAGRGVEVAYLARALQELAPDKYREPSLTAARELLAHPINNRTGALDKNDRNYLFGVLALYGDTSYAAQAQAQMVQADGKIDRGALKYLEQTLREQAIPIIAQAWQNNAIPPDQREPLARVMLNYVGANPQAEAVYRTAINDLAMPKDHRRNLIEDLNEHGFPDPKKLTAQDLPLIQNRIEFIKQNGPAAADKINAAAFAEAMKDLVNMQAKAQGQPNP